MKIVDIVKNIDAGKMLFITNHNKYYKFDGKNDEIEIIRSKGEWIILLNKTRLFESSVYGSKQEAKDALLVKAQNEYNETISKINNL